MITLWEFAQIYCKYHLYHWCISIATLGFGLISFNENLMVPILILAAGIFITQQMKLGWNSEKIRNLLLYREITKTKFTPAEHDIFNRYFGKSYREKIIIELDEKEALLSKVYMIDAIMLGVLTVGAILLLIPFFF